MPITRGYEQYRGNQMGYFQWGESGKKYHYTPGDTEGRERAKAKAERQQAAAHARGYRK